MSRWLNHVHDPPPIIRRGDVNPRKIRNDSRFDVSGHTNSHGRPRERGQQRRDSSIRDWIQEATRPRYRHRPQRRSSTNSSSSSSDLPQRHYHWHDHRHGHEHHHHHYPPDPPPIVLPPLPAAPKRKSKKHLYFIRPHDAHPHHRKGTFGRIADALTGEGPDVFVTGTTNPARLHRDRPQRWQWTNRSPANGEILTTIVEPGFEWRDLKQPMEAPWARRGGGDGYDFRTRRYGGGGRGMWTDARWSPDARRGSWPEEIRDRDFRRWRRVL